MQTPQQAKAIQTWAEQRDGLLREIGVRTTELNDLRAQGVQAGAALKDLHEQIAEARGRLAELDALEERRRTSVAVDVAELEIRKSRLEVECAAMEASLAEARAARDATAEAAADLAAAHGVIKDQTQLAKDLVSGIIESGKLHLSDAKVLMSDIRTVAAEVIEKGTENVRQTSIVLEKLPRYIFELQKPIPVRRAYRVPRGHVIGPDNELKEQK
jgi:chromosome segregation ATPase